MRTERVVVTDSCDFSCRFCPSGQGSRRLRSTPDAEELPARLAAAIGSGAQEIVLTGGEPTLYDALPELVAQAHAAGLRVRLDSNGSGIDHSLANALHAAGLDSARIALPGWGDEADRVTGVPGSGAVAISALTALAAAGIAIEASLPVVRDNCDNLHTLPAAIAASQLPLRELTLVVPMRGPEASALATIDEATAAITRVADAARSCGLYLTLDPATYMPPCWFAQPERVAHLFALNRGNASRNGYARDAACNACLVADRCPGQPQGVRAPLARQPVQQARLRRRLTVVSSVAEQVARELVTRDEGRTGAGMPEHTIRVNFHCNQACAFCFVSTHLPAAAETAVCNAIDEAARSGAVVVLSGGEPTLNPRLVDYVRRATQNGAAAVELQTNALRLAEGDLALRLAQAGLDRAMVSLHGSRAEVSDTVTSTPGTFDATVAGIDALRRAGVATRLNFVFCRANYRDFPAFVAFVAARWPAITLVVSFVGAHTDVVPREQSLIPSFREVLPFLQRGLRTAREAGVVVSGFDSMCGLPVCLLPSELRADAGGDVLADPTAGGEFVKAMSCSRCTANLRCYGLRRGYAELYGTDELQPLDASADTDACVAAR